MKNNSLFLLFCILLSNISFAQEDADILLDTKAKKYHSEFSTRLGLNSLNEINIHYEYFREDKPNILASVGVNYGSGLFTPRTSIFCHWTIFQERFDKRGIILRAGANYQKGKRQWSKKILGIYSYGIAKDVVKDEGCHSGSNSSDYEAYDSRTHSIGLMHYFDKEMADNANFYMGLGFLARVRTKLNHRKGIYSFQQPSSIDPTDLSMLFLLDLGVKVNFLRLKRKK